MEFPEIPNTIFHRRVKMKLRSAVVSFTDQEINAILKKQDLPVTSIEVKCAGGKMNVRVKKGLNFKFSIVFGADGRHLTATVDAGALGNPIVPGILSRIAETASQWGVTLCGRTIVFDPHRAMEAAGITGDFRVERTAVGAGELVFALEGDLPLDQFAATSLP